MRSTEKREILIGLMLEDVSSDFSKEFVNNVVHSLPADKNIRLIVLPGKYNDGEVNTRIHTYRSVHNSVLHLGEKCRFDGMIIHFGSLSMDGKDEFQDVLIDKLESVPKVFIGIDLPGHITVNYDNEMGISETVDYLVNVCGKTNFCMLGGREDNKDAVKRRNIFAKCLADNSIHFGETAFLNTDMTDNCYSEAEKLLDLNPDVQVIFCVNDAAAKALYKVMKERGLMPGKDIMVFGFDNTFMSSELIPSLSSIGAGESSLGQKAVELVLAMINGENVSSALVPTRLFGRDSLPYEMYDYTTVELLSVDSAFIYRMFDDCFYRYKNEYRSREMIDLRRLFFEFISQMLISMNRRFMSRERYSSLCGLIDIFFENGAIKYTDASKLLQRIGKLQAGMNNLQRSPMANFMINRLFLHMKDRAVLALANELAFERNSKRDELDDFQSFAVESMCFDDGEESTLDRIVRNVSKLGVHNAALYLYERPIRYKPDGSTEFPDSAYMKCVVRNGRSQNIPAHRQQCALEEIFMKYELPKNGVGFIAFPVFSNDMIYGLLLCSCEGNIYDKGEYISLELGKALYTARLKDEKSFDTV